MGDTYSSNDHLALREDLELVRSLKIPIVSAVEAASIAVNPSVEVSKGCIAITFDDGSWFDWHDLEHPTLGPQRSFAGILSDFSGIHPHIRLHATSFVIASPDARQQLDRTCLIGAGWWGEEWWQAAIGSGRFAIENHSWDHHHETLQLRATGMAGGTFVNINCWSSADVEIRQASDYLDRRLSARKTRLFAFPYGETSPYLLEEYLPRHTMEHRLAAAFTTEPTPVTRNSSRWALGRYVCGQHWKSTDELHALLRDALGSRDS